MQYKFYHDPSTADLSRLLPSILVFFFSHNISCASYGCWVRYNNLQVFSSSWIHSGYYYFLHSGASWCIFVNFFLITTQEETHKSVHFARMGVCNVVEFDIWVFKASRRHPTVSLWYKVHSRLTKSATISWNNKSSTWGTKMSLKPILCIDNQGKKVKINKVARFFSWNRAVETQVERQTPDHVSRQNCQDVPHKRPQ
jgi:hypothetical protein